MDTIKMGTTHRLIGSNTASVNELLYRAIDVIDHELYYAHVRIFLWDGGRKRLALKADTTASGAADHLRRDASPPRTGIVYQVALTGHAMRISATGDKSHGGELLNAMQAELLMPIRFEDNILGVIDVQSIHTDAFSPAEVEKLNGIVSELAAALENASKALDADRTTDKLTGAFIAIACLTAITLAEALSTFVRPALIGLGVYAFLLLVLLLSTASYWKNSDLRGLTTGLALIPLSRVIGMALPRQDIPLPFYELIVALPMLVAAVLTIRALNLSLHDVGLNRRGLLVQVIVALAGIALGLFQNNFLNLKFFDQPPTNKLILVIVLIAVALVGVIEEVVFRGVIQAGASKMLGRWPGAVYTALLYTILHIGYPSLQSLAFVFVVSVLFGFIVARTQNVEGVALARGLLNVIVWLGLRLPA